MTSSIYICMYRQQLWIDTLLHLTSRNTDSIVQTLPYKNLCHSGPFTKNENKLFTLDSMMRVSRSQLSWFFDGAVSLRPCFRSAYQRLIVVSNETE